MLLSINGIRSQKVIDTSFKVLTSTCPVFSASNTNIMDARRLGLLYRIQIRLQQGCRGYGDSHGYGYGMGMGTVMNPHGFCG